MVNTFTKGESMSTLKTAALYYRVSTTDQSTQLQREDLRRYAKARGFSVYKEYCDEGVSGAKVKRPALDRLMNDARKRKFDVVAVWRFDRFARSSTHLALALDEFKNLAIDFVSFNENIDTSSPMGKVMFTLIGAMAEFERSIIRERVTAGVRRAIQERAEAGKGWGRASGAKTNPKTLATILKLRREGLGCHRIGRQVGLSSRTVWKVLKRQAA
jgi:DNA invertase Pin-like site-specific DNA recombinase